SCPKRPDPPPADFLGDLPDVAALHRRPPCGPRRPRPVARGRLAGAARPLARAAPLPVRPKGPNPQGLPGGQPRVHPLLLVHLPDVSTHFFIYDRDKQVVISFPNLQIGDIIEVKWTTRGKNPQYFGQFFTRYTFGDDRYPTLRDELRVRVPNSKKLTFSAVN